MLLLNKIKPENAKIVAPFMAVLAILVLAGVAAVVNFMANPPKVVPPESVEEISLEQANRLNPIWVDARDNEAFEAGHISGAVQVDIGNFSADLANLARVWRPGLPIVAYCDGHSCDSSRALAQRLVGALGVSKVFVLKGGFQAWQAAQ